MKKNIIDEALNKIRLKKQKNLDAFRKKTAILENDRDYILAEKKYISTVIENRKKEAYGNPIDFTEEKKLFEAVECIKAKHGLRDVTLKFDCPICKDEGYINGKQCNCLKAEISKLLLKGSGFEKLEDFDEATKTAGELEPLYKKMQEWCNANSTKNLIYFCGATGVGKTYLLSCMANEFIKNGKLVNIVTSLYLSIDFKTFSKTNDEELLKKYLTPDVLFIDDLGTEPIFRNVTIEYLYLIINERKMKNRRTVITSNLTLSDVFDRYDERVFSRIADQKTSIAILIEGEDRRLTKK